MFVLPVALILALSPVASSSSRVPRAEPVAPLESLFTTDDYPAAAQISGEEGDVNIRISVDEKGAVSDCVVLESSGSAALDAQTCRVIWMRAKFKPVVRKGKPVASAMSRRIVWRLEGDDRPTPSEPFGTRVEVTLAPGRSPQCKAEGTGAAKEQIPGNLCDLVVAMAGDAAPLTRVQIIDETEFAPDSLPALGALPTDRILAQVALQLEISGKGDLESCTVVDRKGPESPQLPDPCALAPKAFVPRKGPDGAAVRFKGYLVHATYSRSDTSA